MRTFNIFRIIPQSRRHRLLGLLKKGSFMKRVLILEDDPVALKIWHFRIRQILGECEILTFPSVDHLSAEVGSNDNIGNNFDIIISDIFLSGDKTGIEFISQLPKSVQLKTIVSSSVSSENYEKFSKEKNLNCYFVSKPLNQQIVKEALYKVLQLKEKFSTHEAAEGNVVDIQTRKHKKELPVFFITGCSSGVGDALAKKLIGNGLYRVVLTARPKSTHLLREKYKEDSKLMILPLEMTDTTQIKDAVLKVLQKWGKIDVLINNAGVCYRSVVEQMDLESEEIQMKTNYLGPMALIRQVVSVMRENGRGKIINVSSVSGVMGMPTMGSYSASKHAIEGASESLWYELKPFGINVSVVRPGFINNEGHAHVAAGNKAKIAEQLSGPYADFYVFMKPFVSTLMRISPQTSNAIADKIMKVVKTQNPPLWVNATLDAHLFSLLRWILPESWFHKAMNMFFLSAARWGHGYSRADKKRLSA